MPRTMTAYERQTIASPYVWHQLKVETKDADAGWRDVSALAAKDHLIGGSFGEHRDQGVATGQVRLRRKDTSSISPLMTASALNKKADTTFGPLLDLGREIRTSVAVTRGVPPGVNYLQHSEFDTLGGWGSGTPTGTTLNAAVAPDGTNTAMTWTGAGRLFQETNSVNNGTWFHSIFIKLVSGTANVTVVVKDYNTDTVRGTITVAATGTWQRIGIGGSTAVNPGFRFEVTVAGATPVVALWGAMADFSTVMTDYVRTTGVIGLNSWREIFYGRIDEVTFASDPIVIDCSSLDAWLQDTQIEIDAQQYGGASVQAETVIQNVITNWPSGKLTAGQMTVYTPTSPAFVVTSYAQGTQKVLEACRSIAQQVAAWDFRFRYDSTHTSKPTFYDPGRARATIDDTFGPTEYHDVPAMNINMGDVRNVGKVFYTDANGATQFVTSTDAASISKYGRRFFQFTAGSAIKTATQAQTLADAVVNDLSTPGFAHSISTLLHWGVQLYDRHTLVANPDHYDSNQTLAVISVQHEFPDGSATGITTIEYAGKVTGAYADWLKVIDPPVTPVPVILDLQLGFPTNTTTEVILRGDSSTGSWRFATSTAGQPTIATARAAAVQVGQNVDVTVAQAVAVNQRVYITALAYSGSAGTGQESLLFTGSIVRDGTGYGGAPFCTIDEPGAKSRVTAALRITGSAGTGAIATGLTSQYMINGDTTAASWTTPSSAALPRSFSVTRQKWGDVTVTARVTQADGQYTEDTYLVNGRFDDQDITTGATVRGWGFDDGGYAVQASSTDGLSAGSGVKESGTKPINRLLAKSLSGDADNFDGLPEGTLTYRKTLATALTSGQVDISKAGVISKSLAYIGDDPSSSRFAGIQQAATGDGFQVISNPDFRNGSMSLLAVNSGYQVYDNSASGSVTLSTETDNTAPNSSGYRLKIAHTAAGTPSPGFGGFTLVIGPDSGAVTRDTYHRGSTYVVRIRANIPVGYGIEWASNAIGSGTWAWKTSQTGTGGWFEYIGLLTIGTNATTGWSSTNFFYIFSSGGARPFTWYVAMVSMVSPQMPTAPAVRDATDVFRTAGAAGAHLGTIVSNVQDSGHLASAMQESGTKPVNRLLAKTLSGDADNFDGLPDGTITFRKTGSGYVDSSGRITNMFNGSISTVVGADVIDDGRRKAQGMIAGYTGIMLSAATESGGKPVNRLLAKTLAGDPDNADGVGVGILSKVPQLTTLNASGVLLTSIANTAQLGGVAAGTIVKQGNRLFSETCDVDFQYNWANVINIGYFPTYPNGGIQGTRFARCYGTNQIYNNQLIPINPNKLYKFVFRYRQVSVGSGEVPYLYAGFKALRGDGSAANGNGGNCYVLGALTFTVVSGWTEVSCFMRYDLEPYATNAAFGGTAEAPGHFNVDTAYVQPLVLANYPGAGSITTASALDIDYFQIWEYDEDAAARTYKAIRSDGNAQATHKQYDGTNPKSFARGGITGQCRNGVGLTFTIPFQGVPAIVLGGGGLVFQPAAKWGTAAAADAGSASTAYVSNPTYEDSHTNVTRTGFIPHLRLRQKNIQTPQVASFPTSNSVTATGSDTGNAVCGSAPASNDTYTITYDITVTAASRPSTDNTATLLMSVEVDPLGTNSWTEIFTNGYDSYAAAGGGTVVTSWTNEQFSFNVTGMNASGRFRIKAKTFTRTNSAAPPGGFTIHGHDTGDTIKGVGYSTSAGDIYASRTPDSTDAVDYTAVEISY